ncbi:MAG: type II toxin-antitoxin system VapC family toxin [Actinomycetota bacterium]
MSFVYADTSALVRAYLADEPGHAELRRFLLDGSDLVTCSELARVELAGAVRSAERSGRLPSPSDVLDRFDVDCVSRVALVRFDAGTVLPTARALVLAHRLRTLDALHLAVAVEAALAVGEALVFVTRDRDQADVARALGFDVR